jgi:hypothetical protein
MIPKNKRITTATAPSTVLRFTSTMWCKLPQFNLTPEEMTRAEQELISSDFSF